MKKTLTVIMLVFASHLSQAACRIDTVLHYVYAAGSSVKEIDAREIKTYDALNRQIVSIYQYWDNATLAFINDERDSTAYNASGKSILEKTEVWDDVANVWKNGYKTTRVYDAAGQDTLITGEQWLSGGYWRFAYRQTKTINSAGDVANGMFQTWNATTSDWENQSKQTYTYDAAHNKIESLGEQWNLGTSTWENVSKITNTFDASNRLIKRVNQNWDAIGPAWLNTSLYYYTYNPAGKITEFFALKWDIPTADWANKSKQFSLYDAGGYLIKDSTVKYASGVWDNYEQTLYTFSPSKQVIEVHDEEWDISSALWKPYEQRTMEYNTSDELIAFDQYSSWNEALTIYDDHYRTENVCTEVATGIGNHAELSSLMIYPNPVSNGQLFIQTQKKQAYLLCNALGKVILEGTLIRGNNSINVSTLSAGMYILKTPTSVRKISIQ